MGSFKETEPLYMDNSITELEYGTEMTQEDIRDSSRKRFYGNKLFLKFFAYSMKVKGHLRQ